MNFISLFRATINTTSRTMSTMKIIENQELEAMIRCLAPPLYGSKHKGQTGRIGVVGGSLEYTGAPFFAGISALKVGADLTHIFCTKDAATVIKSYSPELIVHPVLNDEKAVEKIQPWLERLHILVIGPGLGRDPKIFDAVSEVIDVCRVLKTPLVIDADGLFLITQKPKLIKDYPGVILTPNIIEYSRLFGSYLNGKDDIPDVGNIFGNQCAVIKKGQVDEIFDGNSKALCSVVGSGRRCGGQGDLLSGAVAVFYNWALQKTVPDHQAIAACYAACKLTRECNARAFKKLGRSMTTSDMIEEISSVFNDYFEIK